MSGAGAKRGAGDGGGGGPPEKKPPREEQPPTTLIEPLRLGGISSTEEMDLKVLQFKNKKLAERLEQRQACEDELRERIEKLEKRQATDDATLLLVNRFWGQLDAEVQALLRRYEGEGAAPPAPPGDPPEPRPEGPEPSPAPPAEAEGPDRREPWGGPGAPPPPPPPPPAPPPGGVGGRLGGPAAAFVAALSRSGPEEGELRLRPRLAFAPAAVARLVEGLAGAHRRAQELGARLAARPELAEGGRALLRELLREHRRLQDLTLQLQEKHHRVSLELAELQDKATSAETKVLEMGTTVEGLQWDSAKLRKREGRLDRHLAEALEQLTSGSYGSGSSGGFQGGQITLSMQKFEMLNAELEGNQELANSRMAELEKLQQELQQAVRGHERLKVALRSLPEEAVKETLEYKVLQSQFSLLYHESLQVKTQLDEARALLLATKNSHLRHIEHMESDELGVQKRLRTEVIQLEDTLAQVRKEYEMLRIEFEQNLAANEQAGPINREMRHLISSLQNHNHQLKGDVQRYKRKLREVQAEINKLRLQASGAPPPPGSAPPPPPPPTPTSAAATTAAPPPEEPPAPGGGAGPAPTKEEEGVAPPGPAPPEPKREAPAPPEEEDFPGGPRAGAAAGAGTGAAQGPPRGAQKKGLGGAEAAEGGAEEGAGEPEGDEAAAGHVQVGAQGAARQGAADGGREEEQGRGGGAARAGAGAGGAGAAREQEAGGRGGPAAPAPRRGADRAPPAQAGRHQAGGGGAAVGDGRDGPGFRGHAGAEPAAAAAAAGEGRRQLQADVGEDQGQPDPQAPAGGEGRVGRAGPRPQGPGGRPTAGGAEAGGEGAGAAEQFGGGGEGAGPALPGPGAQQEEGGGGGAAGRGPAGAGGARAGAAAGAPGLRRRKSGGQGQGVAEPQESPGGAVAAAAEAGEAAEGGGLRRCRPDPPGGDQGVSGPADLPMLQRPQEGRRPHQVLPRLLLRVRQEPLRHAPAQVPQVQRRLRRPRLPPRLHQLKPLPPPTPTHGCSPPNPWASEGASTPPWRTTASPVSCVSGTPR